MKWPLDKMTIVMDEIMDLYWSASTDLDLSMLDAVRTLVQAYVYFLSGWTYEEWTDALESALPPISAEEAYIQTIPESHRESTRRYLQEVNSIVEKARELAHQHGYECEISASYCSEEACGPGPRFVVRQPEKLGVCYNLDEFRSEMEERP